MKKRILFLVILVVLLHGCVPSIPKKFSPNIEAQELPEHWDNYQQEFAALGKQSLLALTTNSKLHEFVRRALEDNLTLKNVELRLVEAQLIVNRDTASFFPTVTLDGQGSRSKAGESNLGRNPVQNTVSAGLGVSWELDVWGRKQDSFNARELETEAILNDLQAARTLVSAKILQAWVRRSISSQIINLEQSRIASLQLAENVIADRFENGLGGLGDLDAARAATASATAVMNARLNAMEAGERRLYVLSGRLPQNIEELPSIVPDIQLPNVSEPAYVIGRRPDLKAAYLRVRVADKEALAAYKDILPSFKIVTNTTKSGPNLSDLLKFDPAWSLIGALTMPVFDAGLRKSRTEIAENNAHRKWLDYRIKLLNAVEEIENALDLEENLKIQVENRLLAQKFSEEAYRQELEKYTSGLTDVVTLLTSERTAFDAKIAYLDVRQRRLENRITLALALGYEE